ncbi:facilitated trehalose transporter Tret1-1-like [Coccinella septempunctata]|uniref:facilitated trehalose transporter Tret1-1-like n=1 Tax=Coccinella septempunctata TaxID=41139 RepID=UPI001D073AA4|nr:facilitated trehalose transporter Tret1-1-like [Coccinella septempunctata]
MSKDDQHQSDKKLRKSVRLESSHGVSSKGGNSEDNPDKPSPYSITEEDLQKRLITSTDSGRKSTQIYSCLVVSTGHLCFGTCLGWASPMMFHKEKHEDFASFYTWMTALVPLGACMGFGVWTVMGYKNGPRKTLLIQTLIYLTLCLTLFFVKHKASIQAGRFFLGFFGIGYVVCGQMLMNDTIHVALLKYMRIVPHLFMLMGVFLVQLTGIFAESRNGGLACIAITALTFLMLFMMPESPVHMYKFGEKLAEDSLSWYIGRKNIQDNMRRIRRDYEYRRMNVEDKYMLNSNVVKKGMVIIIGIIILQVGSGYHLFLFYGTIIWSVVPLISEKADVIILGCVLLFSRLFWSIAHLKLKLPVRTPLILSCTIVATSQLMLASILLILSFKICVSTDYLRWCCFVCCFFVIFGFEMGLNHYTGILVYAYLPFQVYQTALTIVNSIFWFLVFFIIKFNGLWHTNMESWLLFLIASIFLYFGALYVYLFVVEIKGRSLVQIQLDIGGNPVGTRAAIGMRTGGDDI